MFAGLALALAVIGIHGVLSYSVVQRRREIGIRVAIGAEPAQVVRLVLGQGMRLISIGLGVGVGLALLFSRSLAGLLFGITATDTATFAVVVALLATVSMLAMWLPAGERRALIRSWLFDTSKEKTNNESRLSDLRDDRSHRRTARLIFLQNYQ